MNRKMWLPPRGASLLAVGLLAGAPAFAQTVGYDFTTDQSGFEVGGSAGMLNVTIIGPNSLGFEFTTADPIPNDTGTNPRVTGFGFLFDDNTIVDAAGNVDSCNDNALEVTNATGSFECDPNPANNPGNDPLNYGVAEDPNLTGIPPGSTGEFDIENFGVDFSSFDEDDLASFIQTVGVRYQGVDIDNQGDEGEDNLTSLFLIGERKASHNGGNGEVM